MSDSDPFEHPAESDLPLAIWLIPLVAVVLTPSLVWAVAERPMAVRFDLAYGVAAGVACTGAIVLAILSRGFKHRLRWSLSVTTVVILVLFQWPILTFAGSAIADVISLSLLSDSWPVLIAISLLWLATRNGGEWQFAAIMSTATLAVVVALTASVLPFVELASTSDRGQAAPGSPDVILLVLDGYARADFLRDEIQFDNSAFLADLDAMGFTVASQAQSNYGYTYASVSSMLNLDYVFELGPIGDADLAAMRNALSGNPPMMDLYRRAGYEIALIENGWVGSHCGAAVDVCIRDGLAERVLWRLGQITIFAPILKVTRPHPFHSVSYQHLESLAEYVTEGRTAGVPRLTVSHVILPHPPFLRDAQCEYSNTALRRGFEAADESQIDERRSLYVGQMACTNQRVVEAIDQIITAKPNTIVMITADHGPATTWTVDSLSNDWTTDRIREKISILSAYRLPGCDEQPHSTITPVNGTRLVTDCAIDSRLGPIADRTLWAPPPDSDDDVVPIEAKIAQSDATEMD